MTKLPISKAWLENAIEFDEPYEKIGAGPAPLKVQTEEHSFCVIEKDLPVVFVSYSERANSNTKNLHKHLQALATTAQIRIFDDTWIDSGSSWFISIREALVDCPLLLCVIDNSFISSQWCKKEEVQFLVEEAARRSTVVVSVLTEECNYYEIPSVFQRFLSKETHAKSRKLISGKSEQALEVFERIYSTYHCAALCRKAAASYHSLPQPLTRMFFRPDQATLFGRSRELRILDQLWEAQETKIAYLVGGGGIGKSSCVARWLHEMDDDHFRGASHVFTWSFHSQGAGQKVRSSAPFVYHALNFFEGSSELETTSIAPYEAGRRLANHLSRGRALLVIDGLEPLQTEHGLLVDPALQTFFESYQAVGSGLCIITSRRKLSGLGESWIGTKVENLNVSACRAMLRCEGVIGFDNDLNSAAKEYGASPLALRLLAPHIRQYRNHDFEVMRQSPGIVENRSESTRVTYRILASIAKTIKGKPELEVLRVFGLFDHPAKITELQDIQAGERLAGLTELTQALPRRRLLSILARLLELNVLTLTSEKDEVTVNSHPLVREYFSEDLKNAYPQSWAQGHFRLAASLSGRVPEFPDTLAQLECLYSSVMHYCIAGEFDKAIDEIYWRRIQRDDLRFASNHLGIISLDLATLKLFFQHEWKTLVPIKNVESNWRVFHLTARQLWHLGRLREAKECLQPAITLAAKNKLHYLAAKSARRLAEVLLITGDIMSALTCAQKAIEHSDLCENHLEKARSQFDSRVTFACILNQLNRTDGLRSLIGQAEDIRNMYPDLAYLDHAWGYWYCDLISNNDSFQHLLEPALHSFTRTIPLKDGFPSAKGTLLTQGLLPICLLTVKRFNSIACSSISHSVNLKDVDFGIDKLRAAGQVPHLAYGLIMRAGALREIERFDEAEKDLREANDLIEDGGMRLRKVEWYLEGIRLMLDLGKINEARQHISEARNLIQKIKWTRRIADLNKLDEIVLANYRQKKGAHFGWLSGRFRTLGKF